MHKVIFVQNVEKWLQKGVSGLLEDAQNHYENADEDKEKFLSGNNYCDESSTRFYASLS